jgi:hypothetical protein
VIYSSEHATSITDIPFPAVTYCPELVNTVSGASDLLFNYRKSKENLLSGSRSIDNFTEIE